MNTFELALTSAINVLKTYCSSGSLSFTNGNAEQVSYTVYVSYGNALAYPMLEVGYNEVVSDLTIVCEKYQTTIEQLTPNMEVGLVAPGISGSYLVKNIVASTPAYVWFTLSNPK